MRIRFANRIALLGMERDVEHGKDGVWTPHEVLREGWSTSSDL